MTDIHVPADSRAGGPGMIASASISQHPACLKVTLSGANQLVARNLGRLRLERSMSLAAVARRSGLSEQTLSTIEQGLGNPTVVTLAPLGGALDLPRRFLIEGVRRCTSSDTMKANGWMDPSGRSECSMRSLAQVASEQYFSGLSARLKIPTSPRRVSPARFTTSTSSPGNYAQDRSPTSRPQRRRLVRSQATFRAGTCASVTM